MTKIEYPSGMAHGLYSRKPLFSEPDRVFLPCFCFYLFVVFFFSVSSLSQKFASQENKPLLEIWFKHNKTVVQGKCCLCLCFTHAAHVAVQLLLSASWALHAQEVCGRLGHEALWKYLGENQELSD